MHQSERSAGAALEALRSGQREIQHLSHVAALLGWDQETFMPSGAVEARADQIALLEGLLHERMSAPGIGELLDELGASDSRPSGDPALSTVEAALVRETHRAYRRATRLPADLVVALARQASLAQATWVEARKRSSFPMFQGALEELVRLTVAKADALGYAQTRYDALLDEFEPWTTTSEVAAVFEALQGALSSLAARIAASGRQTPPLRGRFPAARQRELCGRLLKDLGFDLARGRLDVSAHPFSTTVGPADIRLTTRYDEADLATALFGTIHECGHGLYEQGFDSALSGSILAGAASLGIHESQSRFWENMVGRSAAFWRRYFPVVREAFAAEMGDVGEDDFYRAVNRVGPSLIRVEADEVTYGLHIILRFDLERRLVSGDLAVADLPGAWAEESRRLIGVAPATDAEGVLQDIHWSMGSIGYFPTYALGNLYAAQLRAALARDLGDLDEAIGEGDLAVILKWLRENVHRHGRVYPAGELCLRATGAALDARFFLDYLEAKFAPIYGI